MSDMHKIILTVPVKSAPYTRAEILRTPEGYQASLFTDKQVFHENFAREELDAYTARLLGAVFTHYTAWDGQFRHARRVTKKGKILQTRTPDTTPPAPPKQKNRIFREGMDIPALTDMGVFTKERKVAVAMRGKFAQINRFVELVADETHSLPPSAQLNIIDFGCGKSYLTFLLYHYFTEMRGLRVTMAGMDNDEKLVSQCNETARKYNYSELRFIVGDIGKLDNPPLENWGAPHTFNIIVSLHACDTATDHALYNAVRWGADLICAVPCCQHEAREQMRSREKDSPLALISRYGIIQERVAALATDAIRAALLESRGYRVSVIELTDPENTAKNLMLRAVKVTPRPAHEKNAKHAVQQMMVAFGFVPALWKLLGEG